MKRHFLIFLLFSFASPFFVSCEDEKNARIEVWLTDDPGDYQEVNIDLEAVEINSSDTDKEQGWRAVDVTPQLYNLLELTNGEETLLGSLSLPGGRLSQIRLKLGENNTIKVNDETYPLSTPSAQQSGLKVTLNEVLAEGITYKILLDFDAAKSVVNTGNNTYLLKPVIRAITQAQDGAIKGKVDPARVVAVSVFEDEDLVTTTSSNDAGEFLIRGLDAGAYRLVFDGAGDAPLVERTGVEVELGAVTDMGAVAVEE